MANFLWVRCGGAAIGTSICRGRATALMNSGGGRDVYDWDSTTSLVYASVFVSSCRRYRVSVCPYLAVSVSSALRRRCGRTSSRNGKIMVSQIPSCLTTPISGEGGRRFDFRSISL